MTPRREPRCRQPFQREQAPPSPRRNSRRVLRADRSCAQAPAAIRAAPGRGDGRVRPLRDQRPAQRGARGRRPFLLQRTTPSARRRLRTPVASAMLSLSWLPQEGAVADSFWISLKYFNFYRIAVAAIFLLAALIFGDALSLGSHDIAIYTYTSVLYLALAVVFHVILRKVPAHFNLQLTLHVVTDVVLIVMLMYASSGIRSGLGVMLLISLAGAALVSRGTLTLFYAALASIGGLLEQLYWVLVPDSSPAHYVQPGLSSVGDFPTRLISQPVGRGLIPNERLAQQRGADLADQLRINKLIIRDVQDGVLVVDAQGRGHLRKPRAACLVGRLVT